MREAFKSLIVGLVVVVALVSQAAAGDWVPQWTIYNRTSQSTVTKGTCFSIGCEIVLTVHHAVRGGNVNTVWIEADGVTYRPSRIMSEPRCDVAVLQVPGLHVCKRTDGKRPVPMMVRISDPGTVWFRGRVSGACYFRASCGHYNIRVDHPAVNGWSGSPILTMKARLAGIVAASSPTHTYGPSPVCIDALLRRFGCPNPPT